MGGPGVIAGRVSGTTLRTRRGGTLEDELCVWTDGDVWTDEPVCTDSDVQSDEHILIDRLRDYVETVVWVDQE